MKELITNKDDVIKESLEKGLDSPGVEELRSFWSQKVAPNLSKFSVNKTLSQYINDIGKRVQDIESKLQKKGAVNDKRKKMMNLHNDGKMKTAYKKQAGTASTNSQFLFNTPLVTDAFKNVIKEDKDTSHNKSIILDSLNNAVFTYKKEELNKNVISAERSKKTIVSYMDLDVLLQRIAMEEPVFHDEEVNDFLLEGICLQHLNFITSEVLISKIISCFKFNYDRYLKNADKDEEEEEDDNSKRAENFTISFSNYKKKDHRRVFISSKNVVGDLNKTVETFQDTESRIPYGLVNLIIILIKTCKKYSINEIKPELANKVIELIDFSLGIYEIKNIYESDLIKSKATIKEISKSSSEPKATTKKIPFDQIFNPKDTAEGFFDVFNYSPKDIATELTRVSYLLFSKIRPKEFFKGLFTKKDKEKTSPNICILVNRFNTISFWVIEEVLSYDYSSDRAKAIEKFINIANELKNLNNFNDCMSISTALGQMIMTKLTKTWKKVSSKEIGILHKIKRLLNFQDNYKSIREEIARCLKDEKPFIPFLGYYTKRICFIEESGKYVKDKTALVNVDKIAQVEQILNEFYEMDKIKYKLDIKDEIKNKLTILQCLQPLSEEELENEGGLIEPNFLLNNKKVKKKKRMTNTEIKFKENYKKNNIV